MDIENDTLEGPFSEFSTRKRLAKKFKKSRRTLDRWHALGIGPPRIKIGRFILYHDQSVADWLISRERNVSRGRQ